MDPSQKAVEPLEPVEASVLVSRLRSITPDENKSPEADSNRKQAAAEVSMIFELRDNRAFQWFETEFIDKEYLEAFSKLRSPHTKPEELHDVQVKYIALRAVKVGLVEREIAHRELMNSNDEQIPRLRERLSRM